MRAHNGSATRSFFPGASAPHRDINITTFQNAASAPQVMWRNFLLVTESAADGCLATTNASGAQPPERFGKKGESSAPSVFHAFLGAICERPLMVQTQLKTKPRHILLKLNSKEMKWTPGHIHALLCSVSCLPRETELAAYKISTSILRKHVEVT